MLFMALRPSRRGAFYLFLADTPTTFLGGRLSHQIKAALRPHFIFIFRPPLIRGFAQSRRPDRSRQRCSPRQRRKAMTTRIRRPFGSAGLLGGKWQTDPCRQPRRLKLRRSVVLLCREADSARHRVQRSFILAARDFAASGGFGDCSSEVALWRTAFPCCLFSPRWPCCLVSAAS
jgi:hypothetical protein